jgi:hypothetical protein
LARTLPEPAKAGLEQAATSATTRRNLFMVFGPSVEGP